MTTEELNTIVREVMAQIEANALDFDVQITEPEDSDYLMASRLKSDGTYSGIIIKWQDVAKVVTDVAVQAKTDAINAKDIAQQILSQVQGKGTEITNFIAQSKTEIATAKTEAVNAVQSVYQTDLNELKGDLDNIANEIGHPLYEKIESTGYMLSTGVVNSSVKTTHCIYTNKIPCKSGDKFFYKGEGSYGAVSWIFYNGDEIISYGQVNNKETYTEVVIPDGVNYVLFSSYNVVSEPVILDIRTVEKSLSEMERVFNPLIGKSISLNGDSICYGHGFLGGFGKIIAEKNNMIYSNIAVSGGTISYVNDEKHCISRTIDNMQSADYMIVEGGVNDASLNVTLGEVTSGFDAELDDTTYCGALESICKKLVTDFHGKKVGFVIVHKCSGGLTSLKEGYGFYYNTKKILEKWGIPYIDLNTECPPLAYIPLLAQTYTYNGDGWHPNELGYKTYYVPKIEAWMKTL